MILIPTIWKVFPQAKRYEPPLTGLKTPCSCKFFHKHASHIKCSLYFNMVYGVWILYNWVTSNSWICLWREMFSLMNKSEKDDLGTKQPWCSHPSGQVQPTWMSRSVQDTKVELQWLIFFSASLMMQNRKITIDFSSVHTLYRLKYPELIYIG